MNLYFRVILIIIGIAYLISPFDIIPDLVLPYIGWLDDGVIIAAIIYFLKTGRLPAFLFKQPGNPGQTFEEKTSTSQSSAGQNTQSAQKQSTSAPGSKTPYDILGVKPDASKRVIQEAYKEAVKKYHPDKLSHLGEEFSDLANDKFLEIQKAYDSLMNR